MSEPRKTMEDPQNNQVSGEEAFIGTEVSESPDDMDAAVEGEMRRISRRSFLWSGVAMAGAYGGWKWLTTRRNEDGIPWPFRRALQVNEEIAEDYFRPDRLSPTFAVSRAREPRVNGKIGMEGEFDPAGWRLRVQGLRPQPDSRTSNWDLEVSEPTLLLTLDDIRSLPKTEVVTELRCIEGWSQIVHWGGARLSDFAAKYPPKTRTGNPADLKGNLQDLPQYVGLATPNGGYYVGMDRESAFHPQTLLCYEMNGQPLSSDHGAPLRLVTPVKYGIKSLKRIGTLRFTDERPADFWAERGYDWYAGH